MMIRGRQRSQNQILVWVLFGGPFLMAPLIQFLRLPDAVKYSMDLAWTFLLLTMLTRKKRKIDLVTRQFLHWIICFFLLTAINYAFHYQSILYYMWGFRNNFRGYVLFFAVIYYFSEEDVNEGIELLNLLFYINAGFMIIQFFIFGYKQDNLGGIFGVESGCNGYINLFFCISLVISYVKYAENKMKFHKFLLEIILMLILAALAELKFFYVEFVIIITIGTLCTKFSWKKFIVILSALIAVIVGYSVFVKVFPDIDLSVLGLYEYASSDSGYTSSNDLNRLFFMETINQRFLPGIINRLFGMGLGNCDYATGIEFLTSPFFVKYESLHYGWMSTTFMYLENGWLGLICFFGFFIFVAINSLRIAKKPNYNRVFCLISALCCVAALLNGFYNISLRIESGYMLYFIIAIPWCKKICMPNTKD